MEVAGRAAAELAVEFVELDMADAAVEGTGTAGVGGSTVPDDASGVTAELDTAVDNIYSNNLSYFPSEWSPCIAIKFER